MTYLPGKNGDWSSFAGGDNIVISAKTDDAKMPAIQAFIEFAYSPEGQTILAKNGSLPVRADVAEQALKGLDARYLIAARAMDKGKTPYTPVFNDLINSLNGPWITMLTRHSLPAMQRMSIVRWMSTSGNAGHYCCFPVDPPNLPLAGTADLTRLSVGGDSRPLLQRIIP